MPMKRFVLHDIEDLEADLDPGETDKAIASLPTKNALPSLSPRGLAGVTGRTVIPGCP